MNEYNEENRAFRALTEPPKKQSLERRHIETPACAALLRRQSLTAEFHMHLLFFILLRQGTCACLQCLYRSSNTKLVQNWLVYLVHGPPHAKKVVRCSLPLHLHGPICGTFSVGGRCYALVIRVRHPYQGTGRTVPIPVEYGYGGRVTTGAGYVTGFSCRSLVEMAPPCREPCRFAATAARDRDTARRHNTQRFTPFRNLFDLFPGFILRARRKIG